MLSLSASYQRSRPFNYKVITKLLCCTITYSSSLKLPHGVCISKISLEVQYFHNFKMSRIISLNYSFYRLRNTKCLLNLDVKLYRWVLFWFPTNSVSRKTLDTPQVFCLFKHLGLYNYLKNLFQEGKFAAKLKALPALEIMK